MGGHPLCMAADSASGHVEIIRLLLDNGADVNAKNNSGSTALHWPAFQGNDEIVRLLIERGAYLHVVNNNGNTALNEAKRHNRSSTAAIIKEAINSTKGKNDC